MNILIQIVLAIAGLSCIGFGAYLGYEKPNNDIWGWFLFVGFLIMLWLANMVNTGNKNNNSKKEKDDE